MIGPNVIQAIIDHTGIYSRSFIPPSALPHETVPGNNWMGFPFLFALCVSAALVIWFFVDVEKGRHDAVAFAAARRAADGGRIIHPKPTTEAIISDEDADASSVRKVRSDEAGKKVDD